MDTVRAIRIHGRGEQGAQMACQMLAAAFLRRGQEVRAIAADGAVDRADDVLVLDPALLAEVTPGSLRAGGLVVVNSPGAPCGRSPLSSRVVDVDASEIARETGLGPLVSTAVLGAFAAATGRLSLEDLAAAVEAGSPSQPLENVRACVAGYRVVAARRVAHERGGASVDTP